MNAAEHRAIERIQAIGASMGAQFYDPEAIEAYKQALARMDWSFEMADDFSAWRDGVKALRELHRMQAAVDPNGSLWLAHVDARSLKNFALPHVGVFA